MYRPQADTLLLAHALAKEALPSAAEVLEIGTGTGALALSAAGRGVTRSDNRGQTAPHQAASGGESDLAATTRIQDFLAEDLPSGLGG
ncbi:hypothetical protein ACFWCA_49070 [Streptomyces phaeochromogenes]|uniref:hypothetical protein n=1 Tax=Streptomyces phaeochromogenes TaxID=1923 RepID=UPI0036835B7C